MRNRLLTIGLAASLTLVDCEKNGQKDTDPVTDPQPEIASVEP